MIVGTSSRHFWEIGWNVVDSIVRGEFAILRRVGALVRKG